jgi:hypothetical protein
VNAPADERLTAGDTGILDTSVPHLLVAAALVGETAFSDLSQTMTELMRVVQQGDAFAYELIHELNQSKKVRLETRPGVWPEMVYSGLKAASLFSRIIRSERKLGNFANQPRRLLRNTF